MLTRGSFAGCEASSSPPGTRPGGGSRRLRNQGRGDTEVRIPQLDTSDASRED